MPKLLPPPPGFFEAILCVLNRQPEGIRRRDLFDAVADEMGLSAAQREARIPSGKAPTHRHRAGWALTMLKHAGLAEALRHGVWGLTNAGRSLVIARPNGLTSDDLRRIARDSRDAEGDSIEQQEHVHGTPTPDRDRMTPDEQIDIAVRAIRREVVRDLLDVIGRSSPDFFEILVLDLLHAMGYGTRRDDLRRVGGSGDGGIDGIITLDKLGLEKVYVQAKRWTNTVGRPDIQAFYGALAGRHARKGVFITTSTYSREATEFADRCRTPSSCWTAAFSPI